jgi:uncharacterized membrane protein
MNDDASAGPDQAPSAGRSQISDAIRQNIEAIAALQQREAAQVPAYLRRLERVSRFMGRPMYLASVTTIAATWLGYNLSAPAWHATAFDPPPFQTLEFVLSLVALITTTVVLIGQNRQSKLEQYRSHLDLQVNLLTELKVTKLIHLLEELRRDLPVRDRLDVEAEALQEAADASELIGALDHHGVMREAGDEEVTHADPAHSTKEA